MKPESAIRPDQPGGDEDWTEEDEKQALAEEREWAYDSTIEKNMDIFLSEVHEAKPILDFSGLLILMTASSAVAFASLAAMAGGNNLERKLLVLLFAGILWWKTAQHVVPAAYSVGIVGAYRVMRRLKIEHPTHWRSSTLKAMLATVGTVSYFIVAFGTGLIGWELARLPETLGIQKSIADTKAKNADKPVPEIAP